MQKSESIKELATALSKAQAEFKPAIKDALNPYYNSKYADLSAGLDAVREPLARHGLSFCQLPTTEGAKLSLTTMLMHSSGEFIFDVLSMTAADARPQSLGSTLTYARRYALYSMLGIATEDDDGNAGSGKTDDQKTSSSKTQSAPAQLYNDDIEADRDHLIEWLKKAKVEERYHLYIRSQMRGKPPSELRKVVERVINDPGA